MKQKIKDRLKYSFQNILISLFLISFFSGLMFINSGQSYIIGLVGVVFFSLIIVLILIGIFTSSEDYWKKIEHIESHPESYWYKLAHPFEQDINFLKLLKKNFIFALPFILSSIAIILFLFFEFKSFFVLTILKNLNIRFWFILYIYLLTFICFSFFILGYLALGEILQKRLFKIRKNFLIDMSINYIYAIPFIAILSLVWIIFVFSSDEEDHHYIPLSITDALRSLSLYAIFVVLKYYTYINLAIIAVEDKYIKIHFRESFEFLRNEKENLFFIWFRSGAIPAVLFFITLWLYMWGKVLNLINPIIFIILFIGSFLLMILWSLLSEQISFLLHFIKTRHKEINIDKL